MHKEKVDFSVKDKLVKIRDDAVLQNGCVIIEPRAHVYSAWKRAIKTADSDLKRVPFVAEGHGGHPGAPAYVVLLDDWRLQPPDKCTKILFDGLLIDPSGKPPIANRPDGKTVELGRVDAPLKSDGVESIINTAMMLCVTILAARWCIQSDLASRWQEAGITAIASAFALVLAVRKLVELYIKRFRIGRWS